MTASAVYLDSSALVKLVLAEPESAGLALWLRPEMRPTSSALARTEVVRAVAQAGDHAIARARALLGRIDLIAVDDVVLDAAALLQPPALRTLDAIHLASAISLGDDLAVFVAYDRRLLEAATVVGLAATSPGAWTEESTEWTRAARAIQAAHAGARRATASDLVLEDRRTRSDRPGERGGR